VNGVDEPEQSRGRDDPVAVGDTWAPVRRPPPLARLVERGLAPIRPWIMWFGVGRLIGSAITIVLAVGVGWWLLRPAPLPTEAGVPYAAPLVASTTAGTGGSTTVIVAETTTTVAATTVVVHIAGAVLTPGVVELPVGSRVADGVAAAGGALVDADLAGVNLAALLLDGQQIYVPVVGEQPPLTVVVAGGSVTSVVVGPIDLNRASASELDQLPGVGPATAAAIVAHRDTNGPFSSVDDLEAVRGIGPAKVESLRPLVTT
jgi:competence protein ComEA